ncbi:MAG: hypothetical protein FWC11_03805 [Firmicutes bacterium]|nr:hypothetical protein [Bacillota bacterium]
MDINTLLPLFLNRGANNSQQNSETPNIGGASMGGDMMGAMLMQMMSKDRKTDSNDMVTSLIKQRLSKDNPQLAPMVQLLTTNLSSQKKEKRRAQGFSPIKRIVPNEILGLMTKLI